jgi:DNA-binding NarL/FixJ family response regulator
MESASNRDIVIADGQPLAVAGAKYFLGSAYAFREVQARAGLFSAVQVQPSLAIIDYTTVEDFKPADMALLRSEFPLLPVLVLTQDQNKDSIFEVLEAGVSGFLFKNCSGDEIIKAVKAVTAGERFYCNQIFDLLMRTQAGAGAVHGQPTELTPREVEIIRRVVMGKSTAAIAQELHLSPHTISTHRKNILKKLQIKSPVELVTYAYDLGLMPGKRKPG